MVKRLKGLVKVSRGEVAPPQGGCWGPILEHTPLPSLWYGGLPTAPGFWRCGS